MLRNKKRILALSLIPQYLLVQLLAQFPEFIETYYSNGLYPILSKGLRFLLGWIPFSVGDILYTVAGIYALRWLYKNRRRIRKDTLNWLTDIVACTSVLYFAFHLLWGLNYYRQPIHNTLGLEYQYTTESLISVTKQLITKANAAHAAITSDDSLKITMPYTTKELIEKTADGYTALERKYPQLKHSPKSAKTSLYSLPLTYMGFSGYLNPFTNEAQIDGLIPLHKFPTTVAHEEGHQIGYAAENETNFIGFLATSHNEDPYFQYSGYIFALRHCLNEVYRRDPDMFKSLRSEIRPGILANYQESYEFWASYQNPFEPVFKVIYGNFLKANNQEKGIESYSYVVALLVNYFTKYPL